MRKFWRVRWIGWVLGIAVFVGYSLGIGGVAWAEGAIATSSPQTITPPTSLLTPTILEPAAPNRSILGADDIAAEKVRQFVQAYLQVLALVEQRESELQGSETESESQRVQQDIETEAFAIIQATGLTSQEYIQLLGLANTDPEFGERVATVLQERGMRDAG